MLFPRSPWRAVPALLAIAALTPIPAPAQVSVSPGEVKPPEIVTEGAPRPVARPRAGREVAVLELLLTLQEGRTTEARLKSARRINSFAPKVFARQGGDWKVTISGAQSASYFINDPATDIEVENPPDDRSPYSQVRLSGVQDWTLVVPLYGQDGESLGAREITITDVRRRREILRAPIR